MQRILNIGSFTVQFPSTKDVEVINIDILNVSAYAQERGLKFIQHDVTKGIPFDYESVDAIYCSHMLEHVTREEGLFVLKEMYRVLKPGGFVRILVPNAYLLCKQYVNDESLIKIHGVHNVDAAKAPDEAAALFHLLLYNHKTIYDAYALLQALAKAGFHEYASSTTAVKKFGETDSELLRQHTKDIFPEISLIVEVRKSTTPRVSESQSPRITEKDPLEGLGRDETIGIHRNGDASTQQVSSVKEVENPQGTSKPNKFHSIALLSTPFLRTPPQAYGGLEQIVAWLGEELSRRGYDVTVYATSNSEVPGCKLQSIGPEIGTVDVDWLHAERSAFEGLLDGISQNHIIHGHNWFGVEYQIINKVSQRDIPVNILHTHHGGLNWPVYQSDTWPLPLRQHKFNLISISKWMQQVYKKNLNFDSEVAYNGIDITKYKLRREKGDRLLFVGRIDDFKNPKHAIQVAKKLGIPIDLVGGSFVYNNQYLQEVKAMCGSPDCRLYLNAPPDLKTTLLQNAKAVLIPSKMGEPFNLVAIEAAACGTPVIAYEDGGLVETVKPNVSGYTVPVGDIEKMVDAVRVLERNPIKPDDCRAWAENFTVQKMTDRYLDLYQRAWEGRGW